MAEPGSQYVHSARSTPFAPDNIELASFHPPVTEVTGVAVETRIEQFHGAHSDDLHGVGAHSNKTVALQPLYSSSKTDWKGHPISGNSDQVWQKVADFTGSKWLRLARLYVKRIIFDQRSQ